MKLSRKGLRSILIETLNRKDEKINTDEYAENIVNQEFESPIKDKIESDSQKQDQVMSAEEDRYDLPFTNRDIRLLLLSYIDKIQEIAQSKDYSTLSQINSRVLNYIDNLQMKISEGTAAYPAYSNKIDKNLSMFYYQSPDIGEDFKGYCRALMSSGPMTGVEPVVARILRNIVGQIIKMSAVGQEINFLRQDDARKLINKISSYQLLQLSKGITKDDAITAVYGYGRINLFDYFTRQRGSTEHILKIIKRINESKKAIEIFQQSAEGAASVSELGDDVGYQGTDLIDALLEQIDIIMQGKDISEYPHFVAIQKLAEGDLYDSMDDNNFRLTYKLTRKLIRLIQQSPGREPRARLLNKAGMILKYTDRLRFDLNKHIPKLVRTIRASIEGFQTLFENKRRNKMKLTRKNLRKMILNEILDANAAMYQPSEGQTKVLMMAKKELERIGHPLPHVVLNMMMKDFKEAPSVLPQLVFNKYMELAGVETNAQIPLMKGLPSS